MTSSARWSTILELTTTALMMSQVVSQRLGKCFLNLWESPTINPPPTKNNQDPKTCIKNNLWWVNPSKSHREGIWVVPQPRATSCSSLNNDPRSISNYHLIVVWRCRSNPWRREGGWWQEDRQGQARRVQSLNPRSTTKKHLKEALAPAIRDLT